MNTLAPSINGSGVLPANERRVLNRANHFGLRRLPHASPAHLLAFDAQLDLRDVRPEEQGNRPVEDDAQTAIPARQLKEVIGPTYPPRWKPVGRMPNTLASGRCSDSLEQAMQVGYDPALHQFAALNSIDSDALERDRAA